jgi:preprotein translocase subunit YajC
MSDESLQAGDWVRTDSGEIGVVVNTTRQTAFLKLEGEPVEITIRAFLLSRITKIDPPILEAGHE